MWAAQQKIARSFSFPLAEMKTLLIACQKNTKTSFWFLGDFFLFRIGKKLEKGKPNHLVRNEKESFFDHVFLV